jgi:hypothetical protein
MVRVLFVRVLALCTCMMVCPVCVCASVDATAGTMIASFDVSSITTGVATDVVFTTGATAVTTSDLYGWSVAGAGDCSAVTPSTAFVENVGTTTAFSGAISVTLTGAGVYKLCVRASGNSDSVAQAATMTVGECFCFGGCVLCGWFVFGSFVCLRCALV